MKTKAYIFLFVLLVFASSCKNEDQKMDTPADFLINIDWKILSIEFAPPISIDGLPLDKALGQEGFEKDDAMNFYMDASYSYNEGVTYSKLNLLSGGGSWHINANYTKLTLINKTGDFVFHVLELNENNLVLSTEINKAMMLDYIAREFNVFVDLVKVEDGTSLTIKLKAI